MRDLKVQFWLIAMACGCFQVLQAMTNGAAARAGIGAIWVGAISATVSAVVLVLVVSRSIVCLFPKQTLSRLMASRPSRVG